MPISAPISPLPTKKQQTSMPLPVHSKLSNNSHSSVTDSSDHSGDGFFTDRVRFCVLALTTVCLTLGISNSAALFFTVICMKAEEGGGAPTKIDGHYSSTLPPMADRHQQDQEQPMFSFAQQGLLFSALSLGTLVASLASDWLCNRLGFRRLTTLFGLTSGLATLATPGAATWLPEPANFYALATARLAQGFILALSYLAMGKLSCQWSPLKESTLFVGVISTHLTLGRSIVMPVAGLLCESPLGWPSVYYLFGSVTVACFLLFHWFYRDFPHKHRKVSRAELARIESGRNTSSRTAATGTIKWTVYIELLANPHIWAVFVSDVSVVLSNQLLAQYGPTYLKNTVGLSTHRAGMVSALPFLLSAILATLVGRICDRLPCLSGRPKLIVWVTNAWPQYMMAICYVVLALLPVSESLLIQATYIVTLLFPGIWFIGIVKQMQLVVSPQRIQSLMSLHTAFSYFCIMLVPNFVNLLKDESDDAGQWNRIFMVVAVAQVISGAVVQISLHLHKSKS